MTTLKIQGQNVKGKNDKKYHFMDRFRQVRGQK